MERKNRKNKRFLFFYSLGLFLFAGVLILLSYLSSLRVSQELTDSRAVSAGKDTQVEQLTVSNKDLSGKLSITEKENKDLQKKLAENENTLDELELKIQARDILIKMQTKYYLKDTDECKALIDEMESRDLEKHLSDDGKAALEQIKEKLRN